MFRVEIETNSRAFQIDPEGEVRRALEKVLETLDSEWGAPRGIYDSNGEVVGKWEFDLFANLKEEESK